MDGISEQPLLSEYSHNHDLPDKVIDDEQPPAFSSASNKSFSFCPSGVVVGLLIISFVVNVILITVLLAVIRGHKLHDNTTSIPCPVSASTYISPYTGLSLDKPSKHYHHTAYWSANQTLADDLWESIDTDPMVVALSDDFADAHDLPRSDRFPWDETKGRYFVKVFHQLHCLKFIRRAFADYQRGRSPSLNGQHVHHCLDTLRQDVTCMADDTPMPTGHEARAIGDEQPVMCRNMDKLVDWIYAPERNACHRALDDYRSITHSVERYAFCEKGTEPYIQMKKYFDKHGHVDPWS